MNRRTRTLRNHSPVKSLPPFLKYLKPGALALLRDSRISARSHRFDALSQIAFDHAPFPSSAPSNHGQSQVNPIAASDEFLCFSLRSFGPCSPQRKKLVAARPMLFVDPTSQSPVSESGDVFASDVVTAH